VQIALPCTLRRPQGSPIAAQTLDLGAGGMLVRSGRPLAIDEEVDFDLTELEMPVSGHARVLRQQRHDVYALRFEGLQNEAQRCLLALTTSGQVS
jgi:c-di-GMP-binding flagellar brake protein YcgR